MGKHSFVWVMFFSLIGIGCDSSISDTGFPDAAEATKTLFPQAIKQEKEHKKDLLYQASEWHKQIAGLTVGPPEEVSKAVAKRDELREEYETKLRVLREPVTDLLNQLEALSPVETSGYYANQKRRCGIDGCGGTCESQCRDTEVCMGTWCSCVPDCAGKTCGSDGCGGYCGVGSCSAGSYCNDESQCVAQETTCRSNCRNSVSPGSGEQAVRVRDYGTTRQSSSYKKFASDHSLSEYINVLTDRLQEVTNEIKETNNLEQSIAKLEADIQQGSAKLNQILESIQTTKVTLKELDAQYRKAKATGDTAAAADAETGINTQTQSLQDLRQKYSEQKREQLNLGQEFKKNKSRLRKASGRLVELQKLETRISAERERQATLLSGWQSLMSEADRIKGEISALEEKLTEDFEDLDDDYLEDLEELDAEVGELTEPVFPEGTIPIWDTMHPLHLTSLNYLVSGPNDPFPKYMKALNMTFDRWSKSQSKISSADWKEKCKENVAIGGSKTPEYSNQTWGGALDGLTAQLELCRSIEASAKRLVGLRKEAANLRARVGGL
jgi:uncharacterized protein YoxC